MTTNNPAPNGQGLARMMSNSSCIHALCADGSKPTVKVTGSKLGISRPVAGAPYPPFNTFLTSPSGQVSPAAITRTRL
ncbi:hypothetical protein ACVWXM_008751 [Bradyrhizobium sp. GM7.3]